MVNSMNNNAKGICLMLLCSMCLSIAQLIWKLMTQFNIISYFVGIAFCGLGAILMILSYRLGKLSVLQPINSMSFIYSLFLAALVLHENVTIIQIFGVTIIIVGIILIGGSEKE